MSWILDLKDHCEIAPNAMTLRSSLHRDEATFDHTLAKGGVFCVATYYWGLNAPSLEAGALTVG